jgi:hypothetical protein
VKPILDPNDPFFAKAWVRVATVLVPAAMGALEFWNASPGWGVLFAAMAAFAFWQLFIVRVDK